MLVLALAALAPAYQKVDTLVREGDVLPWGAQVSQVNNGAMADTGDWVANVYIEAPTESNNCSIRNGELIFQEDSPLGAPPGMTATGGGQVDITSQGQAAVWTTFDDPGVGCCTTGIWLDPELLIAGGDPLFGSTWGWIFFSSVAARSEVLVSATFEDTDVNFMAVVRQDPLLGPPQTKILLTAGYPLPGLPGLVHELSPHALGANGSVLYTARYSDDPAEVALYRNHRLLAIQGGPSPIAGATFDLGHGHSADLNDHGQVALLTSLQGSPEEVLLKDRAVVAAPLDILSGIEPFQLVDLVLAGHFSVRIGNTGQILWHGSWNEPWSGYPEPSPSGLFLDDRLLVRNGAMTAEGQVIRAISYLHLSRSGRYASFSAYLEDDTTGLFAIDLLSSVVEVPACSGGNLATLSVGSGAPVAGTNLELLLDDAQAAGALGLLALSTSEPQDPCGVAVAGFGELLLAPPLQVWSIGAWSGGPLSSMLPVPDTLAFVGTVVRAQGAFVDASPSAPEPVRLSDGLALRVGAF